MQQQETIHAVMAPLDDDSIRSRILTIRGVQVILDRDIAILYGVETKALNQAVKRNRERFPDRFMFQLTEEELGNWKSQIVTSNPSLEQSIRMGVRRAVGSFHDRFLILDDTELYHFGASMKDLGRQYCAITKMDAMFISSIMQRIL